jgi:hypothetical protein
VRSCDDPLAALAEAYVQKVNLALARGELALAAELAATYADEGLALIASECELPSEDVVRHRLSASRTGHGRRLWPWTAR